MRFEDLTGDPELTLRRIYQFLGEEQFEHDFDHVEQVTWEDDRAHGYVGLHEIRSKVEGVPVCWPEILGEYGKQYSNQEFWA